MNHFVIYQKNNAIQYPVRYAVLIGGILLTAYTLFQLKAQHEQYTQNIDNIAVLEQQYSELSHQDMSDSQSQDVHQIDYLPNLKSLSEILSYSNTSVQIQHIEYQESTATLLINGQVASIDELNNFKNTVSASLNFKALEITSTSQVADDAKLPIKFQLQGSFKP